MKLFDCNFSKYRKHLNKKCCIYKITNTITKKEYVGSSVDTYLRLHNHRSKLKLNTHGNKYLQASFNLYGEEVFKVHILKFLIDSSKDNTVKQEQYFIDTLKPKYNLQPFAYLNRGYRHTPEAKEKIRISGIGRKTNNKIILQYSKDFKLVKEWESFEKASQCLNINSWNIKSCCKYHLLKDKYKYKRNTAGGYIWKYKI